jgi:hypothetical protein
MGPAAEHRGKRVREIGKRRTRKAADVFAACGAAIKQLVAFAS